MSTINVLIVDDEPDISLALGILFKLDNIASERTGTLAGALARILTGGIDCVVLDLTLPDARGIDAVTKLRAVCPDTPLVVFTGDSDLADEAIAARVKEVIVKPGDPAAIQEAVRQAVAYRLVGPMYEPAKQALDSAEAKLDKVEKQARTGQGPTAAEVLADAIADVPAKTADLVIEKLKEEEDRQP